MRALLRIAEELQDIADALDLVIDPRNTTYVMFQHVVSIRMEPVEADVLGPVEAEKLRPALYLADVRVGFIDDTSPQAIIEYIRRNRDVIIARLVAAAVRRIADALEEEAEQ